MCSGEEEGASLQRGKQSEADTEGGREMGDPHGHGWSQGAMCFLIWGFVSLSRILPPN